MANGRRDESWWHTAQLCAVYANANPFRPEGAKAAKPEEFHLPTLERKAKREEKQPKPKMQPLPVSVLKGFFTSEN